MTDFNIDALLDGTLDDLADAPEFKPYPAGSHLIEMSLNQKKVKNRPTFELKLKAIETKELTNKDDAPLNPGDECTISFFMDTDFGQGGLKNILKAAAEKFGAKPNRQLIEDCQGAQALVITTQRPNKEKTAVFTQLVEVLFV